MLGKSLTTQDDENSVQVNWGCKQVSAMPDNSTAFLPGPGSKVFQSHA